MKITKLQGAGGALRRVVAGACNCNTCSCCNFKIGKKKNVA
ncbi:hypothetical protein QWY85_08580 [Neolewinella lacunae]|nr:hypothetical protein [Neolewinella lacunae]MDN3634710.1 hypothetical protein [Neolewinella lacunae]